MKIVRFTVEFSPISNWSEYGSWSIAGPILTIFAEGIMLREDKYGPTSLVLGIM